MPQVAVMVAAAAASSAAAGMGIGGALFGAGLLGSFGAAVMADAIFSAVVGFAVQSLGGAMMGQKNKKKASPYLGADLQSGLKQVVRMSDESYKMIYGRARVGGTMAYVESSNNGPDSSGQAQSGDNLFLHMVIIHAGHEVDGFEELYLDDNLITLDDKGFVKEEKYVADGNSFVRIRHHLGSPDQAADSVLIQEGPNWTPNHRLRGLAYSYVRLQWNSEIFQSGIPTFNAVIRGKKVYDPRDIVVDDGFVTESADTTVDYGSVTDTADDLVVDDGRVTDGVEAGVKWTDNAALCIRDYLTSRDPSGLPYGFGAKDDEIDDEFTIAAANISDDVLMESGGGTIKRYTINGAVDLAAAPLDTLENKITAIAGGVTYPQGKFRIHAGAYDEPEEDVIDEDWLTGELKPVFRIPRQDLFNAVMGTFINPDKAWQKDDIPAITSAEYEAQDNGEQIFTDIELPYTINSDAAQRILKITQRKGREQISVEMPCNYRALKFTVWDNVKVSNAILGWDRKVFKVVGHTFDFRGGVSLRLREENAASYDWNASDAEAIAAAPDTNLPNPRIVSAPSGVSYNSRSVDTAAGDKLFSLMLSWSDHSDAFVRAGGHYEIQYKLSSEALWRPSFTVSGRLSETDIGSPSSANTSYDLRVRAVNVSGGFSNWVTLYNAIIGSSGGVGGTEDWGDWTSSPGSTEDWGDFVSSPASTEDWEYFL